MGNFVLKEVSNNISDELKIIGFDNSYIEKAANKYKYKNIKIFSLTHTQANILKQIALSTGADCATHKDVITAKIDLSDVILGGSYSQLYKIAEKLKLQPFSLKDLSDEIIKNLVSNTNKTKIVGILNITDNSFSDGGKYINPDLAIKHFNNMISDGADIIDIGAESTKPGAQEVPYDIQLRRILPILEKVDCKNNCISIDTRSSKVAEKCLEKGAKIINDVSGLKYDERMAKVVAKYDATIIIQHSKNIINRGANVEASNNIVEEVYLDLKNQTKFAEKSGIKNIIIDIGIGFDKTVAENFELLKRIDEFKSLGYPIMVGVSRKSFLDTENKDTFSLAINSILIEHNIDYLRVHNIKLHREFIDMIDF